MVENENSVQTSQSVLQLVHFFERFSPTIESLSVDGVEFQSHVAVRQHPVPHWRGVIHVACRVIKYVDNIVLKCITDMQLCLTNRLLQVWRLSRLPGYRTELPWRIGVAYRQYFPSS